MHGEPNSAAASESRPGRERGRTWPAEPVLVRDRTADARSDERLKGTLPRLERPCLSAGTSKAARCTLALEGEHAIVVELVGLVLRLGPLSGSIAALSFDGLSGGEARVRLFCGVGGRGKVRYERGWFVRRAGDFGRERRRVMHAQRSSWCVS